MLRKKLLIIAFVAAGSLFSFAASANTCPSASPQGVGCTSGSYYCASACRSGLSWCPTWSPSTICASGLDCSNCSSADACGVCNSCNSGYRLCGAYPNSFCKANGTLPANCATYNTNCDACASCVAGYTLSGSSCVAATLKLGSSSVSGSSVVQGGADSALFVSGNKIGLGISAPTANLQINSSTDTEGLRIITSNYSPFIIRNSADTADLFRIDENGNITSLGSVSGSNTYWNLNGSNLVASSTNWNVGIGTTNPSYKLYVAGGDINLDADQYIRMGGYATFTANSTRSLFGNTGYTQLRSNGVVGVTLDNSQNVGVGLTNPSAKLDVSGALKVSSSAQISLLGGSGNRMVTVDNTGVFGTAALPTTVGAGTSGQTLRHDGTSWVANSALYNNGTNVGIGTTNPSYLLDVVKSSSSGSMNVLPTINVNNVLAAQGDGSSTFNFSAFQFGAGNGAVKGLFLASYNSDTNYGNEVQFRTVTNHNMSFWTNSARRMTILNSGNVGVGTTAPEVKLDVFDGAIANRSTSGNHYRNVLTKYLGGGNQTGTLEVVLPKFSDTMLDITFKGYDWSTASAWEARISGYVYIASNGWYGGNYEAQIIGSAPFSQVRLAYNGTRPVILLGNTSTTWSYSSFEISDVSTSYASFGGWGTGWTANLITDETGRTINATPTIYTYITPLGNVGIGTTNPGAKLDVNGTFKVSGALNSVVLEKLSGTGSRIVMADASGSLYATSSSVATGLPSSSTAGQTLRSDGTNWVANSVLYNNGANIGVGTTIPSSKFTIGNLGAAGEDGITLLRNSGYGQGSIMLGYGLYGLHTSFSLLNNYSNSRIILGQETYYADGNPGNIIFSTQAAHTTTTVERMRIISGGNIGIGTTAPRRSLDVVSSSNNPLILQSNSTTTGAYLSFYTGSGLGTARGYLGAGSQSGGATMLTGELANSISLVSNQAIHFGTNGNNLRMTIDTGGNVGIGTTTPGTRLTVVGSGSYSIDAGNFRVGNVASPVSNLDAANKSYVDSVLAAATSTLTLWGGTVGGNVWNLNSGNVGIGTTNPGQKLQISGDNATLNIEASTTAAVADAGILLSRYGISAVKFNLWHDGDQGTVYLDNYYDNDNGDIRFRTKMSGTAINALIIKGSGNVGIGTTNPSSKLQVSGDFSLSGASKYVNEYVSPWMSINAFSASTDTAYLNFGTLLDYGHLHLEVEITGWANSTLAYGSLVKHYDIRPRNNAGTWTLEGVKSRVIQDSGYVSDTVQLGEIEVNGSSFRLPIKKVGGNEQYAIRFRAISWSGSVINNLNPSIVQPAAVSAGSREYTKISNRLGVGLAQGNQPVAPLHVVGNSYFNGNVGIGTATLTSALSVSGGNAFINDAAITSGTPKAAITKEYLDSSLSAFNTNTNLWKTDGSNIYASSTGWNVGIGTTTPGNKLSVYGSNGDIIKFGDNTNFGYLGVNSVTGGAYLFTTGTQSLRFGTGNTERIRIDSSGNVGIGITNPTEKLEINGDIKLPATTYIGFGTIGASPANGDYLFLGDQASPNPIFNLVQDSASKLFVQGQTGNVGIGLTAPSSRLHLSGAGQTTLNLETTDAYSTLPSVMINAVLKYNSAGLTTNMGRIVFAKNNATDADTGGYIAFYKKPNGAIIAEAMRIDPDGNVGIGTTNPGAILSVSGGNAFINDAAITSGTPKAAITKEYLDSSLSAFNTNTNLWKTDGSNIYASSTGWNVGIGTTNPNTKLQIVNTSAASTNGQDTLKLTGNLSASVVGSGPVLRFTDANGTSNMSSIRGYTFGSGATGLAFETGWNANTVKMVIDNSGNVGIGTTNPSSRLHSYNYSSDTVTGRTNIIDVLTLETTNTASAPYRGFGQGIEFRGRTYQNSAVRTLGRIATVLTDDSSTNTGTSIVFQNVADSATVTSPVERMRIRYDGNVGIGTTAPQSKLEVSLGAESSVPVAGADSTYFMLTGSGAYGMMAGVLGSGNGYIQQQRFDGATTTYNLLLQPNGGKVGIGTINPSSILTVNGPVETGRAGILGNYDSTQVQGVWSIGNGYQISTVNNNFGSQYGLVYAHTNASSVGTSKGPISGWGHQILFTSAGDYKAAISLSSGHAYFAGNVGIGTTNPGAILSVSGGNAFINDAAITSGTPKAAVTKEYLDSSLSAFASTNNLWNNSGSNLYASSTTWNVGIGTTAPGAYKLNVVGSIYATGLTMGGDINLGGNNLSGINKLTVSTIDPLYNIKGVNYSTFASAIVGGVKEEYVGRINIDKQLGENEYEKIVDFDKLEKGSDLWVWRQVVDFSPENIQVLITPYGNFASAYYEISGNRLIFKADRPASISYRLIGKRFDWQSWPTKARDQKEKAGLIIH